MWRCKHQGSSKCFVFGDGASSLCVSISISPMIFVRVDEQGKQRWQIFIALEIRLAKCHCQGIVES